MNQWHGVFNPPRTLTKFQKRFLLICYTFTKIFFRYMIHAGMKQ